MGTRRRKQSERRSRRRREEGRQRERRETDNPRYTLPLPSSVLLRSFMTEEMRASSVFWNPAPSSLDLRTLLYFWRNDRGSGCQHRLDGPFQQKHFV